MNRQEAIKQLKTLRTYYSIRQFGEEYAEALGMAISSLETDEAYQLEYEQPEFCADCISREAVKHYIQAHIHEIISESGTDKNAHTNAILRALLNGVATMPSVYPKSEDYIKANEQLKKQIEMLKLDRDCEKSVLEDIKTAIEQAAAYSMSYPNWEYAKGLMKSIEIIDNHISGKEQNNDNTRAV